MDDFIAEVEYSAHKLLRACNKKRRDMALIKEKRANVERIKHSCKSNSNNAREGSANASSRSCDDKMPISPTSTKAINLKKKNACSLHNDLQQNPLYHDGMFEAHQGASAIVKSSHTYSRSEKSRILTTLKESQVKMSRRKRSNAVIKNGVSDRQTIETDWSLDVLRKKYRCELLRGEIYQSYLHDLTVEQSLYGKGEEYVSKIKPIYHHPIEIKLKVSS